MDKKPLIIIVISFLLLGLAFSYFLNISNSYSFKENMPGYGLVFSGISFLILGFALKQKETK